MASLNTAESASQGDEYAEDEGEWYDEGETEGGAEAEGSDAMSYGETDVEDQKIYGIWQALPVPDGDPDWESGMC